ncbi:MAG: HEAT repeat domain-containing protein [Acidobacteriota bacterium]|nr:HEAT repeat domain-containing protein [Acidobacteriota bacterium]
MRRGRAWWGLAVAVPALLLGGRGPARAAAPPTFEQVVAQLGSPQAADRLAALHLLQETGYREAQVPVAALLNDPVPAVRLAAIATEMNCFLAEKLVARSHVALVVEVRNRVGAGAAFDRGPLAVTPQPLDPKVLSGLLIASADPDPRVALEAVYALGVVGPLATGPARDELVKELGQRVSVLLRSGDAGVRRGALAVLGRVADRYGAGTSAIAQPVGDAVVSALNDPDAAVRAAAVGTLGQLRYVRAIGALTQRYQYYGRGPEAAAALEALARIAYPTSLPLFQSALTSQDGDVRAAAVDGIARLGDAAAVNDVLGQLRTERDDRVNLALNFATARTGERVALAPLVSALANPALRASALADLLELTATRAADADNWQVALRSAPPASRLDLVHILGLAGDTSLVRVLQPLAQDGDARVAAAARLAIDRLQQVPGRP